MTPLKGKKRGKHEIFVIFGFGVKAIVKQHLICTGNLSVIVCEFYFTNPGAGHRIVNMLLKALK